MVKWLVTLFCIFFAAPALTQDMISTTGPGPFTITVAEDDLGRTFMRYDGAFVPASGSAITNYLTYFSNIDYIEFHSPGGVLLEIHEPGAVLRDLDIPFVIREGDVCVSACAFLALYSRNIELDGLMAFHLPYRPEFRREETLYDISQSMVERTLRQSRQMFENDWLLYLYLVVTRKSDISTYVVFADIAELNKFRMTDKSQFMDRPEVPPYIIEMNDQQLSEYVSTHRE